MSCCVIDLIALPINLYTQQGWHISEFGPKTPIEGGTYFCGG